MSEIKVVTVHRGARDSYQVARGLSDHGLLEALVTDLYWPADLAWARRFERLAPRRFSQALGCRHAQGLPSSKIVTCLGSGFSSLVLSKAQSIPFSWQRDAVRWCDRSLGRRAGQLASSRKAALLSYSYYGHSAFTHYTGDQPRILFQLHPHPASVQAILRQELELNPDCASSLLQEWELALPKEDFDLLVEEPSMAEHWLVASSFTKQTLVESGQAAERIHVIPYGIDLDRFTPRAKANPSRPLQLLFVGTLGQRKGIKYLLEAMDLLPPGSVELTVCGRPVDDLAIFKNRRTPVRVRPAISVQGLIDAYQTADLFVFPSLVEGFAQVLLEAMASGLPVISTTRTAAPDLIRHGQEGFIIEPGNTLDLAKHIEHFLRNPEQVTTMGIAARHRAEQFTWGRFGCKVAETVAEILEIRPKQPHYAYV